MKIINMGDYQMDDQDRKLQDMFAHASLADDDFSNGVVRKVRRREMLRKWLLPSAFFVGVLIAAAPAMNLLSRMSVGLEALMSHLTGADGLMAALPESTAITMVLAMICVLVVATRLLDDEI